MTNPRVLAEARNLYDAAVRTLNAMEQTDPTGTRYASAFPFERSMDEVVAGIGAWVEALAAPVPYQRGRD